MSKSLNYRYLNKGSGLMYSPLFNAIKSGQNRAPANQWANIINSLKSKGVKEAEINDSGLIYFIGKLEGPVTKDVLLDYLESAAPLVKEIDVEKHKYKPYSFAKYGSNYQESLYLLAGEDDFLTDKLLDVQFELEDLDFYPERLIENPMLAQELYEEEQSISGKLNSLYAKTGISTSHWRGLIDPDTGKKIESLLFHTRSSIQDDGKTFLVEEVQSDWAQRGRQYNWSDIPQAPWVTNTELWAGLAFRRLMQRAAENPEVKKFTWITGDYRNGGQFVRQDGLNDFYIKVVGKLVNRALSGTGEKAAFQKIRLGNVDAELPSFEMTDKVREKLLSPQPLYSRDHAMRQISERAKQKLTNEMKTPILSAKKMLGQSAHIKLLSSLLDEDNQAVSGRFLGDCVEVSLAGQNPARALSHECWHYAHEHLLTPTERRIADYAFNDNAGLLDKLKTTMTHQGFSSQAIAQCDDPQEAVAHAFSLWIQGDFELDLNAPEKLDTIFNKVESSFDAFKLQVHDSYELDMSQDEQTPPLELQGANDLLSLFEQMRDGMFAHRAPYIPSPAYG